MPSPIDYSFFDISKTLERSNFNEFHIDVHAESNIISVENVDGTFTDIGNLRVISGYQIDDAYISPENGSVIVDYTKGYASTEFSSIKRDYELSFISRGIGLYTGEINAEPSFTWVNSSIKDQDRITVGETQYRYIIPKVYFNPVNIQEKVVDTTNQYSSFTPIEFGDGFYDELSITCSSILESNPNNLIDRDPLTFVRFNHDHVLYDKSIIYKLPANFEFNAFVFQNSESSGSDKVYDFTLLLSDNGDDWVEEASYSLPRSEGLNDIFFNILPSMKQARYVKLVVDDYAGNGAIGTFNLLTVNEKVKRYVYLEHKPLKFDEKYYTFSYSELGYNLSLNTDEQIIENTSIHTTGFMKWTKYSKFDFYGGATYTVPAGATNVIPFNTDRINNLRITRIGSIFVISPGVYRIKCSLAAYRSNYHYLYMMDTNGNILCYGTICFAWQNYSGSSSATSEIDQIVTILEEVRVSIYHSTEYSGSIDGIPDTVNNTGNVYSSLEIWKLQDITDNDSPTHELYWDNVTLLMNGVGGISDQSKYRSRIMNHYGRDNGIDTVPYEYGKLYEFDGSGKVLCTLASLNFNNDSRYFKSDMTELTAEYYINPNITTEQTQCIFGSHSQYNSNVGIHNYYAGIVSYIEYNEFNSAYFISVKMGNSVCSAQISPNILQYVVIRLSNNTLYMHVDGVLVDSQVIDVSEYNHDVNRIMIGGTMSSDNNVLNPYSGKFGNFRLTSGVDRYKDVIGDLPIPTFPISKYY